MTMTIQEWIDEQLLACSDKGWSSPVGPYVNYPKVLRALKIATSKLEEYNDDYARWHPTNKEIAKELGVEDEER